MINFAVNYSQAASQLLQERKIQLDIFKCPAWPDVIAKAQAQHPAYVHCPLRVGMGIGDALDTETKAPANWSKYEAILAQTDTPWVSLHLGPDPEDHPDIPITSLSPKHAKRVADALIRDMEAIVARFGPDRVVGENIFGYYEGHLWAAMLPDVLHRVVEATGCGFLLDLSHARLAARDLGVDWQDYVKALPVAHVREIHITGIQRFTNKWIELSRRNGVDVEALRFLERDIDHLPMLEADWESVTWMIEQIHNGVWATPSIIAFECGGVGWIYEAVMDADTLAEQVPRLYKLIKYPG